MDMLKSQQKPLEHWRAFSPEWFAIHQDKILWLLNYSPIRNWFRRKLFIDEDLLDTEINYISCNRVVYDLKKKGSDIVAKTEYRTHEKYSKTMYNAFKPLWWGMHYADEFCLDKWFPEWSFGFTTLVAHPDPTPEVSSMDGEVHQQINESNIATLRAGAGNNSSTLYKRIWIRADTVTNTFDLLIRGITLYDTSSIGGDTINSVIYSLNKYTTLNQLDGSEGVNIFSSSPASNTSIANGDYDSLGDVPFSTEKAISTLVAGYNNWRLNASGIANINKTGISKFGERMMNDYEDNEPTWSYPGSDLVQFYTAEAVGTSKDPKLTVEHAAASGSPQSSFLRQRYHHRIR